jgi:hypothetical protein
MVAGAAAIIGAVLIGFLPVLWPYLEGGAAELAAVAERELPGTRIVLYETRPEAVAFALERSVPTYSSDEHGQLLEALRAGPTALIVPMKEWQFWSALPARVVGRSGDRVLLAVSGRAGGDGAEGAPRVTPRGSEGTDG